MGQKILHKSTRCEEKNNKKLKRNQKLDFPPINAFGENNRYKSFPVATTDLNQLLFHFLWHCKKDKIKCSVVTGDRKKKGAKMIDIKGIQCFT